MTTYGRIILPLTEPVLTASVAPAVGSTLTIYSTGTTTPANIYADSLGVTPLANPQTADAAGRFYLESTEIWADNSVAYDAVLLILPDGQTISYEGFWTLGPPVNTSGFLQNPNVMLTGVPTAPTPAANDSSSKIATTAFVQAALAILAVFPSGMICAFGMISLPSGWLNCNGAAVSRTTYAALFGAIGTSFGIGDGTTTFNLPNFLGYFARGANPGGLGAGPTTAVGATMADALQGHYHAPLSDTTFFEGNAGVYGVNGGVSWMTSTTTGSPVTDTVNGTPRTANETRPSFVAVTYAIKT